jgi:hypothetical protein
MSILLKICVNGHQAGLISPKRSQGSHSKIDTGQVSSCNENNDGDIFQIFHLDAYLQGFALAIGLFVNHLVWLNRAGIIQLNIEQLKRLGNLPALSMGQGSITSIKMTVWAACGKMGLPELEVKNGNQKHSTLWVSCR